MTDNNTRKILHPPPERPDLDALLKKAVSEFNELPSEVREAILRKQRESWVRGNIGIDRGPDARRTVSGNNTYDAALCEAQEEIRKLRDLLQSAADERDKWFYLAQLRKDELAAILARSHKEEKQMTTFGLVDRTYARGKAEGAAAERDAIVAWLRLENSHLLDAYADRIERGEHHKPELAQRDDDG